MTTKPKRYTLKEVKDNNDLPSRGSARKHSQRQVVLEAIRTYETDQFSTHSLCHWIRKMPMTDEVKACGSTALSKSRWAINGRVAHVLRWMVAHGYAIKVGNGYRRTSKVR